MPDPINWSLALPYFIAALVFGYVLGSIPFGLIITRIGGLGDIRKIGSGNIGATNVLRTGNKFLALATVIADIAKGLIAFVATEHFYGIDMAMFAGLGAFLGHCYPIWLKFKGGKGVAVFIGILIGVSIKAALIFGMIWVLVAALTQYSSLAGIITSLITPPTLFFLGYTQAAELFLLLTIILVFKHRSNIKRLIDGNEGKIGEA